LNECYETVVTLTPTQFIRTRCKL